MTSQHGGRRHDRRLAGYLALALLVLVGATALPAASAEAGRLLATGHDVDDHCDSGTTATTVSTAASART